MSTNVISNIKIRPVQNNSLVKANVEFEVAGMFRIHATIMENDKGTWVSYPGHKYQDKATSKEEWFKDVDTLSKEVTQQMKDMILAEYNKVLAGGSKATSATSKPKNQSPF